MLFSQVRQYVKGILANAFNNKLTLDKLGENNNGLTFNGNNIPTNEYIGDLTELNTTAKSDLVSAINEAAQNTCGNQVDTIPTASSSYENKIVQYIGDTDSTYTNGYFYKCIEDPENEGEYIWINEQVQDGESGGGGHEIEDSSGTSLTQRDVLQFAGDFEVSDDSTNEKTVVAPHELTNEDMAEIMSTLPSPVKHGVKYSLQEQVIGEWIDGKPLYQRTLELTASDFVSQQKINRCILSNILNNYKEIIDVSGYYKIAYYTLGTLTYNLPGVGLGYSMDMFCNATVQQGYLALWFNEPNITSIQSVTVTFKYTKTTD